MGPLIMILLSLVVLPLASCHTMPAAAVIKQPLPLPPGTEITVQRAEEIGRVIFEQDDISARASDALFRENIAQNEKRVRGWITLRTEDRWLVRYIGDAEGQDAAYYDVTFQTGGLSAGALTRLHPPEPLAAEQLAMFRARQTALRAMSLRCSDRYNPVVLPGKVADAEGWVVYLLAATPTPGEVMIGGHSRIEVSPDGGEVKRVIPLSRTCWRMPKMAQGNHKPVGLMTTHVVSDTPVETHVYLSLLHRISIFVSTSIGVWNVENGKIQYEQQR
jgi:hypothetical protein